MKTIKITIEISQDQADNIAKLIAHLNLSKTITDGFAQPLTIESLAEMLMDDANLAWRRPGSWEGSNMNDVLTAHGYEF